MNPFFGHAAAADAFAEAMASGRLHHGWLLAGPRGVGKARFAQAVALRLLADAAGAPLPAGFGVPDEHPAAKLFAAGSHPDYRLLRREVWKGDEIVPEADRKADEAPARSIRIKQVRGLDRMLSMLPTFSSRRIILIDAADDLERSAANALLKRLEEPPAGTIFLLVSHAPGRLLPTIRSRCRVLRFARLDDADMDAALRQALPDSSSAEIAALVAAGQGSPGRALGFAGLDIAALDDSMTQLIREGAGAGATRLALARSLSGKAAQRRYETFLERAPSRIAAEARARTGPALADVIGLWSKARDLAAAAQPLSLDPQAVVFELSGMLAALGPALAKGAAGR